MKSMTCRQLGGACDEVFKAETFEEMAELSKRHGMEMMQKKDADHLEAMKAMQELMQSKSDMQAWFMDKQRTFEALPNE